MNATMCEGNKVVALDIIEAISNVFIDLINFKPTTRRTVTVSLDSCNDNQNVIATFLAAAGRFQHTHSLNTTKPTIVFDGEHYAAVIGDDGSTLAYIDLMCNAERKEVTIDYAVTGNYADDDWGGLYYPVITTLMEVLHRRVGLAPFSEHKLFIDVTNSNAEYLYKFINEAMLNRKRGIFKVKGPNTTKIKVIYYVNRIREVPVIEEGCPSGVGIKPNIQPSSNDLSLVISELRHLYLESPNAVDYTDRLRTSVINCTTMVDKSSEAYVKQHYYILQTVYSQLWLDGHTEAFETFKDTDLGGLILSIIESAFGLEPTVIDDGKRWSVPAMWLMETMDLRNKLAKVFNT